MLLRIDNLRRFAAELPRLQTRQLYVRGPIRLLEVTAAELLTVNADGSGREVLLSFEPVVTYSDYVHFPRIDWTTSGERA